MAADRASVQAALAAIEAQRARLGDAVTELALAPLRDMLDRVDAPAATVEPATRLRRAQVTVLFADIVDSTALASRLDAEDVLQVFGRMLERAAACVQARGGRVLRYTGDGLKAGFGTQGTREDDAAQAVLAGLDILAAGREHAEWVAREHGVEGFALRVGAHTGEVALGAGFEADNTLTGDTVNIAARMEQAAPPGTLRISADTHAQVRGLFELQAQPPLAVKGIDAPLQTWLVQRTHTGALRRSARGIEGVPTRMIGREVELGLLQAAHARLLGERRLAAVTVVADAGVGKSRLLDEFEAWRLGRPERTVVLRGHTTPQTEGQIFGLLRDLLARHVRIADDDSVDAARGKLERGIVPLFIDDDGPDLAEAHAHLLGHLIGVEWRDSRHIKGILGDPRQLRNRALHAATQLFRRLAARDGGALLLAIEDLHWADAESLDFLDQLADANPDVPLLLLAFTRPTLYERRPAWGATGPHQRIDLVPLGPARSDELAAELLQKLPEVPAALSELLSRHAEGNPFYMEELVKMLIDRGAIQTGDPWHVDTDRLHLTRLPGTLTGVLQARLDGLPAPEKRALQQASVVGTVFWEQVLAAIDARATAQLPALARRALAVPRAQGSVEGLNEYAFHHQLLQQVTYATVLKQDRREGHAKVARWLAALADQGSVRAGDFLGTAAEHFEQAGDAAHAAEFHTRAAEHAAQRLAHERVLHHVGRALARLGEPGPAQVGLRWRLLSARETTWYTLGRRQEQTLDLETLANLADEAGHDGWRADVARRRANCAQRMGDMAGMAVAARHFMACAARTGNDRMRVQSMQQLALAQVHQGELDAGQSLAMQGLAEARALGLRDVEAPLLTTLAIAADQRGDPVGALELDSLALPLYREIGDRGNEGVSLANLGWGWMSLGDLPQARRELDAALQLLRANGERAMQGLVIGHLSTLALWQGDVPQALLLAQSAVEMALSVQARGNEVIARCSAGGAELARGRVAAARQAYAQALEVALEIGSATRHDASAGLARVALADDDPAGALAALQPMLVTGATPEAVSGSEYPRQIELTCHLALARVFDSRAGEWLRLAHTTLMAQADAIHDPERRRGFLHHIPTHRDIVAAGSARLLGTPANGGPDSHS